MPLRVLFLCTGNSARSQMAEAVLRQLSRDRAEVFSAGTEPRSEIHPLAREAVRRVLHVEMREQYPKPLEPFVGSHFDYIITVCDRAAESCPVFPGDPERIHWSFEDPAAVRGTDQEQLRAFETVARQLVGRIRIWMALPSIRKRLEGEGLDDGGDR